MKLWDRIRNREDQEIYYYDSRGIFRAEELAENLYRLICEELAVTRKTGVVILCIGTDCSTGDSLGPLIGYKLQDRLVGKVEVVGTLDRPVHAMNLEQYRAKLLECYPHHIVVAVDASVGNLDHVGFITLGKGSIKPGLGVSKNLREVGDIFITGIVGSCGNYDPLMLQSVRLSMVMRLADCISESIVLVEKFWGKATLI